VVDGDHLLVHFARANPVWSAILARPNVLMSVVDDYAFIPSTWRMDAGGPDEDGVPTSYYAAVQLGCRAEIVDELQDMAELLGRQLAHFQPAGDHAVVAVGELPYGPMLESIRGVRLHVESVRAKFKYDDQNPEAHREAVADRLDVRGGAQDGCAATQQRRRLQRIGDWQSWSRGKRAADRSA
jgi:transcriptional regulator